MSEDLFDAFSSLDIRVGTVIFAEHFAKARKPAYKLRIDFGEKLGTLQSSAQITELYTTGSLVGKQVLAVINFAPKQVADFMSQCLVLGVYSKDGVVLLAPERPCANGDKLG